MSFTGKHHTEESKRLIAEASRGRRHTDATKEKISMAHKGEKHHNYGKQLSDETKQKISQSLRGKSHPQFKYGSIYKQGDIYRFQYFVDGKKKSKSFAIKKYGGEEKAKQKCDQFRNTIYPELLEDDDTDDDDNPYNNSDEESGYCNEGYCGYDVHGFYE
jgi:hypothetical protein